MVPFPRHHRRRQAGAVHLLVVLLLLVAMLLGVLGLQRGTLVELRMAGHQLTALRGFEAAEAGLDWAEALLGSHRFAADDCRPDPGAARSVRERWTAAPGPVFAACVAAAGGAWRCGCPSDGSPASPASTADTPAHFALQIEPAARAGQWRVRIAGGSGNGPASTRHEAILARLPALARPPTAAVLQRGAEPADAFFAATFGLAPEAWHAQPVVHRLACSGDCTAALVAALVAGERLIAIDADAVLHGPLVLGSATAPLALVARGALALHGVVVHGLVHAAGLTLGAGTQVRGAVLSAETLAGDPATQVVHDTAVLAGVAALGLILRVPGSWRDF